MSSSERATAAGCGVHACDPQALRFATRATPPQLHRPMPEPGGNSMESMFDRVEKTAGTQLTKMRWALGLNGLLAVAVGGLYYSFTAEANGERGWLIFSGLLGIAVGIMVLVWPNISELALLYVIGAYAIVLGIVAVVGAFWLPIDGGDTALLILSGLVSIAFGVVMFAKPGDGALVTLALIAAFALVTGITELIVAIGGKRLAEYDLKRMFAPAKPQPSH